MSRQARGLSQGIRRRIDEAVEKGGTVALALFAFALVLREGARDGVVHVRNYQELDAVPGRVRRGSGARWGRGARVSGVRGGKKDKPRRFLQRSRDCCSSSWRPVCWPTGRPSFRKRVSSRPFSSPSGTSPARHFSPTRAYSGGFLTSFFGWNPTPDFIQVAVWAVYLLVVGYAFLQPQLPKGYRRRTEAG